MAIITISRGSYSKGKEVAEKVAAKLGYECISREVLIEASEVFNIPEVKLVRALHDAPSVLDRFTYGKQRYLAYIQAAFLEHVFGDNVVYHGLAGHFFLKGVAHSLKVRIIADTEDRVKEEMARENISRSEALKMIKKDDDERRRWSLALYGMDTWDPSIYDLVIHIRKIQADEAVEIICRTALLEAFKTTRDSQQALEDLLLAARVKAKLVERHPEVTVTASRGQVFVNIHEPLELERAITEDVQMLASRVDGVKSVKVHVMPSTPYE
ncbi:MAG: cytidylate kinase-like family protein [Thermodesulfobacteriota bacterium]